MVIQIDGGASTNKGAQLMLVAVMQEIKQRYPNAKLIINNNNADESLVQSIFGDNFTIPRKASFYRKVSKLQLIRIAGLFSRKLSCYFTVKHAIKGADVVLNIGGFQFGDQWNHNEVNVANWKDYLKKLHDFGAKIVFMPQAFGPFNNLGSKKMLQVLNDYSDMIMARDDISYDYLIEGGVAKEKVFLYPDFTASVKPKGTESSQQYSGRVCIIPNSKIIQKGVMDKQSYFGAIIKIINHIYQRGFEVVLLNHEGKRDYYLCKNITENTTHDLPIVAGLNAIETKGMIASSYLVISSRFHGVANSLSSCVPCLATSWSHKYKKLLDEYRQGNCLLDLSNIDSALSIIDKVLKYDHNEKVRQVLVELNTVVKEKNRDMWNKIWNKL